MDGKDIEAIKRAITEAKRLVKESAGLPETAAWLLESGKLVKQGFITDERLYNFLKSEGTDEVFLRNGDFGIDKSLYRLLLLHYHFSGAAVVPKTLAELREAVQKNDMLKQHFSRRHESGLFIIYLQQEEKAYWIDFARSSDGDHSDIETLNDSLTLCRTDLRTLLDLISRIKEKLPDRASYRLLGESILLNLKSDPALRQEVFSSVDEFFLRPEWREMLPYFYRGAIDNNAELFLQQHGRLLSNFQQYSLSERLYVLATACPEDELSLFFFYHDAAAKREEKAISAADFLKLVLARNRTDNDTIDYVTALSKTSRDKQELIYLSDYLLNLMEDHQEANWFRSIALNIIPAPFPELTGNFDHLLTTLVEKDANFVYQLLTMRFAVNGAANFLDGPWHELPDANSGLFEAYLVSGSIHLTGFIIWPCII